MKNYLPPLLLFVLFACNKTKEEPANPDEFRVQNTVSPVVVINGQKWTQTNLGVQMSGSANVDANYGKLSNIGLEYTAYVFNSFTPPNGYRLPTKQDFEKLLVSAGAKGTWIPIKDVARNINGTMYEVTDQTVINKLLSKYWKYVSGTNETGFFINPSYADSDQELTGAYLANERTRFLCAGGNCYVDVKAYANGKGFIRIYDYEYGYSTDSRSFSLRFVK